MNKSTSKSGNSNNYLKGRLVLRPLKQTKNIDNINSNNINKNLPTTAKSGATSKYKRAQPTTLLSNETISDSDEEERIVHALTEMASREKQNGHHSKPITSEAQPFHHKLQQINYDVKKPEPYYYWSDNAIYVTKNAEQIKALKAHEASKKAKDMTTGVPDECEQLLDENEILRKYHLQCQYLRALLTQIL